jgi:hypothetical protein
MRLTMVPALLGLLGLLACTGGSDTGDKGENDSGYSPPDDAPDGLVLESAFAVPERAWDLAISDEGHVFCSAQSGGKLYSWDPVEQDRDEETDDMGGLRALAFVGSELYMTLSDQGVTGSLSIRDGRRADVLHTQADDGTLFRDPVDLVVGPDGGWVLADYKAPGLFHVDASGAVVFLSSGSVAPNGLAFEEDWLWIAGDDGIWRMDWPAGTPEVMDSRSANGLLMVDGALWAASSGDDIFLVGGDTIGGSELARPGSMAVAPDGSVFVADRVGEDVWIAYEE